MLQFLRLALLLRCALCLLADVPENRSTSPNVERFAHFAPQNWQFLSRNSRTAWLTLLTLPFTCSAATVPTTGSRPNVDRAAATHKRHRPRLESGGHSHRNQSPRAHERFHLGEQGCLTSRFTQKLLLVRPQRMAPTAHALEIGTELINCTRVVRRGRTPTPKRSLNKTMRVLR